VRYSVIFPDETPLQPKNRKPMNNAMYTFLNMF